MIEFQLVLFKNIMIAFGGITTPSAFLEQLDFIDAPNIRLQIWKWNIYLYVDSVTKNIERNKKKVTLAQECYSKGFATAQLDMIQKMSIPSGKA